MTHFSVHTQCTIYRYIILYPIWWTRPTEYQLILEPLTAITIMKKNSSNVMLFSQSSSALTYVDRCIIGLHILIQVSNAKCVERCCTNTMQKLTQHEDVAIQWESTSFAVPTLFRLIGWAQPCMRQYSWLVSWRGEVRQCKYEWAESHYENSPAQPAGLVPCATKIAHERQAHTGSNVIRASDESSL